MIHPSVMSGLESEHLILPTVVVIRLGSDVVPRRSKSLDFFRSRRKFRLQDANTRYIRRVDGPTSFGKKDTMKTHFVHSFGGNGLASSRLGTEADTKRMPKVIIGAVGAELAEGLAHCFAKLGWRVAQVHDGEDASRLAKKCKANAVFLPVDSFTESGFLACAKLVRGQPKTRVVLVGEDSIENEQFARFAGAAGYVTPTTLPAEVASVITGRYAPTMN